MDFNKKEYEEILKGKTKDKVPYKKYIISEDESITIYNNKVKVREYKLNEEEVDVTISSKHCNIISGLETNKENKKINKTINSYIELEKEYNKPKEKIKRLVKKIGGK